MRRQRVIFGIYLALAFLGAWMAPVMVRREKIFGAAAAYLVLMAVMAAAFVIWAWAGIRKARKQRERT